MRIAVLGTGVVGGLLGACLLRKGHEVTLVDASARRVAGLKASGLKVRDPKGFIAGDFAVQVREILASPEELGATGADILFVCVKACVLAEVLPALRRIYRPGLRVVSFQNGLNTEELLASVMQSSSVFRVVVNYAGRLLEDGAMEVGFFNKPNYIGALEDGSVPEAGKLAELLTGSGLDTEPSDSIQRHVWEKAILNASMSPLSALTGLTMRDVMDRPELQNVVRGITQEGIAVARACGIRFPNGFFERCMDYLGKGGRHKPSMLVDVEAGHRTEIDFLNGKICEYAQRGGVSVPYNQTITALIHGLEANLPNLRRLHA